MQRLVRALALGAGVADAARLLRPALAGVERPPGGAVRPGGAPLLHLRPGAVSAGLHLPRPACWCSRRLGAVPVHRGGRAPVVRLRLPADGLHRDLHVGRAPHRGRPQRAHASSTRAPWSLRQAGARGGQARACGSRIGLWTGFTFVGYFTPIRDARRRGRCSLALGPWEMFWVLFYGFATYGNAGFMREQVCKYMCPYARFQSAMFDRDTLIISYDARARRAARLALAQGRPARAGPGRLHRLHACACRSARPASTSARACSTSASAAPPASTSATAVMDKMDYPRGLIRYATAERRWRSGWTRAQMLAPRAAPARAGLRRACCWRSRSAFVASLALRDAVQGRRGARPRRAGAHRRRRPDRERLPPADHERDRAAAALRDRRSKGLPGAVLHGARPGRGRLRAGALGAGARAVCRPRRRSCWPASRVRSRFRIERLADGEQPARTVLEKSTFIVPR